MSVRVVVDSTADIPCELVQDLGIIVVPVYVRFGEQTYRDRVDISEDAFFEKLQSSSHHPTTSQPAPQDFIDVYQRFADNSDGIYSLCISRKLSGTYDRHYRPGDY
jgi:DegV family protein with EDD domain